MRCLISAPTWADDRVFSPLTVSGGSAAFCRGVIGTGGLNGREDTGRPRKPRNAPVQQLACHGQS